MNNTPRQIQVFDQAFVSDKGGQLAEKRDGVSGWALTKYGSAFGVVFSRVVNGWVGSGSYDWLQKHDPASAEITRIDTTTTDLPNAA